MQRLPKLLSRARHQNITQCPPPPSHTHKHTPNPNNFTIPLNNTQKQTLAWITLLCLSRGNSVHKGLGRIPNQNTVAAVRTREFMCAYVLTGGTSVHILDIHFYCNRKHLGPVLPCSEVTCGFQTPHSFLIAAWEHSARENERETIKWGHNCLVVSSLLPASPPTASATSPLHSISC